MADRAVVLTTVVAAFAPDPCWAHLLGEEYPRLAPLFAGALFDQRVGHGTVWMLDDASSVALWDPPGASDDHEKGGSWSVFDREAGPGARSRLAAYDEALASAAPAGSFWYLGVLATRPGAAGQGRASRVIEPGLAAADQDGLACCLETSTDENAAFYRRRGFVDASPLDLPDGPTTWWMTRPAV